VKVLITSGGTREPIDDVRYVGNLSTGKTGALIAEEFVRGYHTVYLLAGTGALLPAPWAGDSGLLVTRTFGSTADLLGEAEEIVSRGVDCIIQAAAIADYTCVPVEGKLSSRVPELTIRMHPTPKVIDRLRALAPDALLVAFKLESEVDQEELFARARATLVRSGADLVVANHLSGHTSASHAAWVLDDTGVAAHSNTRRQLAAALVRQVQERVNS